MTLHGTARAQYCTAVSAVMTEQGRRVAAAAWRAGGRQAQPNSYDGWEQCVAQGQALLGHNK
jgi:hypothetical protein